MARQTKTTRRYALIGLGSAGGVIGIFLLLILWDYLIPPRKIPITKMTEKEILMTLNSSNDGFYTHFVDLGQPYSFLIDCRLNVFCGETKDDDRWAIAVERLGYNPRAGRIILEITYFGNSLINLEYYNGKPTNNYSVYPIDDDHFQNTINDESLKEDADFWLVRGERIALSHNKEDYANAGIKFLKDQQSTEIRVEQAGRLTILQNRNVFRATDTELYKSIPADMKKILVLDEWYHKDFYLYFFPKMSDEFAGPFGEFFFEESEMKDEVLIDDFSMKIWKNKRPSSYETWKLIAKVIVNKDPKLYQPKLRPNTHWSNWPESGSL